MKTAIFVWLFLFPIQIYASSYNSFTTPELTLVSAIEKGEFNATEIGSIELTDNSELTTGCENFKAIGSA
ncbi:hypothetical protein [Algoriphagus antarcticus]|uniref:Uncharacterized protein n=1 Tax=Algoriphagus antarcticus TaxID=238540 RepID=A0A3E0DP11_9BACT|nr:hypothetical protein [Algoriphagus antarcticus]REG84687.1 hypothetical protein C8N25_11436 [Algoriphagus antarcticus]